MYVPEIRFCGLCDLPALIALNAMSQSPWPESIVEGDLREGSEAEISYLGAFSTAPAEELLGYAVLGREGRAGLLMSLLVHPDFRRLGIGVQLLAAVGDCALYLNLRRLRLRVRRSNTAALSLYEGMSFRRETTCPGYYADGEDAIVMSAPLPLAVWKG